VLSKTGFDKYKMIDVQYAGQVIGSKQPGNTKVDLVQLRKNVEKLLQDAMDAQADTTTYVKPLIEKPVTGNDSTIITHLKPAAAREKTTSPNAMKTTSVSNPGKSIEKPKETNPKPGDKKENKLKLIDENKKPKAVMPKKDVGASSRPSPKEKAILAQPLLFEK
jgi:cell division protein FtsQ